MKPDLHVVPPVEAGHARSCASDWLGVLKWSVTRPSSSFCDMLIGFAQRVRALQQQPASERAVQRDLQRLILACCRRWPHESERVGAPHRRIRPARVAAAKRRRRVDVERRVSAVTAWCRRRRCRALGSTAAGVRTRRSTTGSMPRSTLPISGVHIVGALGSATRPLLDVGDDDRRNPLVDGAVPAELLVVGEGRRDVIG